jgi:hypothetical protein
MDKKSTVTIENQKVAGKEIAEKKGPYGKIFFEWVVPEYLEFQRGFFWYLGMIILALGLIIYSIVTANFLFALVVILVVFIVFLKNYNQAKHLSFQIAQDGIIIGNQFFKYSAIKNFYIIYDPPAVKKLFFIIKGLYPTISIPLDDMNPLVIRKKLLEYLKEDLNREHQSFDDQLEILLKL